ncbi:MAG: hypothetical protein F6K24_45370 [Okeania sp. SIO2D1]|nr:hypothetical protein [Okeania sp. SIO2D1]
MLEPRAVLRRSQGWEDVTLQSQKVSLHSNWVAVKLATYLKFYGNADEIFDIII